MLSNKDKELLKKYVDMDSPKELLCILSTFSQEQIKYMHEYFNTKSEKDNTIAAIAESEDIYIYEKKFIASAIKPKVEFKEV